jgi:hypothetical protein
MRAKRVALDRAATGNGQLEITCQEVVFLLRSTAFSHQVYLRLYFMYATNVVNEADRPWFSDSSSSYCGLLSYETGCERLEEHHISTLKMEVMCSLAAFVPTF